MKIVLPGSAVGVLGGGETARMLALAAYRMGYRVYAFSPADAWGDVSITAGWDDTERLREFAASADVVIVASDDVPLSALQAVAESSNLQPGPRAFEAATRHTLVERDPAKAVAADFVIIGVRSVNGSSMFYDPIAVDRVNGVADISRAPAAISLRPAHQATEILRRKMEELEITGVACGSFTLTADSQLPLHEFNVGPHRAGDVTVVASVTSQYEQHLRAVCGLPLGSTDLLRPAAMAVLSEEIWSAGDPNWAAATAMPEVKLHLNGVRSGFLTGTAASGTLAKQIVRAARASLSAK
ncbi:MAG TPA: ATP-grasp domain-containing protein [Bryobacteraceae bacterium]|nr:ATP-grasp domain-containing protein [Bryobacteraceae bacterium]